jgi:hypothetical protein
MQLYLPVITAVLGIATTVLLFIVKRKDDELSRVRQKVSDRKHDVYSETIALYFKLLKDQKKLAAFDSKQLTIDYIEIKKNLLLIGSDAIIFKFFDFEKTLEPAQKMFKYCELVVLMRKDMGSPATTINANAMLRTLLIDEQEYEKLTLSIPQAKFSKCQRMQHDQSVAAFFVKQ